MKTLPQPRVPLFVAALLTSMVLGVTSAAAQVGRYDAAAISARKQKAADAQEAEQFPHVTRVSPHLQATKAGGKALNEILALYQAKQYPQALSQAEALATSTSNNYERGVAYQLAATAAADAGDNAKAAGYFKKSLESNVLDNNDHYQAMYNLVVTQYQAKQPADALATLERLVSETKSQSPQYAALRASLLADLKRPDEAAALYEQQLAANPADMRAMMNAVATHQQAGNNAKATALLAAAQKKGLLTDASQYRALYVGYINDNKAADALAVIDEGIARGVVTPSPDLAKAYAVLAQNAYADGDMATAIAMYQRAAPMATDGEAALNLAKVLLNENRPADARRAAQQALDKGVRNPAEAKQIAGQTGN